MKRFIAGAACERGYVADNIRLRPFFYWGKNDIMRKSMNNIGVISILLSKRESNAEKLNKILTDNSQIIRVRTGYNLEPKCVTDCLGVITLICDAPENEIITLKGQIDAINEAKVEVTILT